MGHCAHGPLRSWATALMGHSANGPMTFAGYSGGFGSGGYFCLGFGFAFGIGFCSGK